jgi:FkbM family methyltransferase
MELIQEIQDMSRDSAELLDLVFSGLHLKDLRPGSGSCKKPVVVFGTGEFSAYITALLAQRGIVPSCYCDNDASRLGTLFNSVPVLSVQELKNDFRTASILVATYAHRAAVLSQLLAEGFEQRQVFIPDINESMVYEIASQYWSGFMGPNQKWIAARAASIERVHGLLSDEPSRELFKLRLALATSCLSPSLLEPLTKKIARHPLEQYFDATVDFGSARHREDHAFLDAGAYTGDTIDVFLKWTGKRYRTILAFEPEPNTHRMLRDNTATCPGIEYCTKVLWSTPGMVPFEVVTARTGSGNVNLSGHATCEMEATTIDTLVAASDTTFIKMDIEGAELEALKGGAETIRRNRPVMAICVYHRPEHLIEIPLLLLDLLPNSRMYLRHYLSPNPTAESVLYMIPE